MTQSEKKFHLSIVATSRNDDHGKNLLQRMQHFINGVIEQCKRHNLKAELILVEWNFPEDRQPLFEVLEFPKDTSPCAIRFIRVPKELHDQWPNSEKIPLFQMIAKNVGIRRAQGEFILATNIDILFPDVLIRNISKITKAGMLYRVNRFDVPLDLPKTSSLEEILNYCSDNYFRIHNKFGSKIKKNKKWIAEKNLAVKNKSWTAKKLRAIYVSKLQKLKLRILFNPHTNACGDFTLLSYADWKQLRGYPEWPIFSWHIDSIFLFQAYCNGIKQKVLPKKMSIFHIEHDQGSGYTPEFYYKLIERLKENNIPYINDIELTKILKNLIENRSSKENFHYNNENWGLADVELEEIWL